VRRTPAYSACVAESGEKAQENVVSPEPNRLVAAGVHVCAVCGEPHTSRQTLADHVRDGHFTAADRGTTGSTGSGHSGTSPPIGTGGVATP
jgi:hypothetical protein